MDIDEQHYNDELHIEKLNDRIRELEAENLALHTTLKKAELLAAHLKELNNAIMENVNKAMEIVNGR